MVLYWYVKSTFYAVTAFFRRNVMIEFFLQHFLEPAHETRHVVL